MSKYYATIQKLFRRFGLEVRRNAPPARDDLRLLDFMKQQDVDIIFDAGANIGQFAQSMFGMGFDGEIISFEAIHREHAIICEKAKTNQNWTIAPQAALTDHDGETKFYINKDSATSSTLPASEMSEAIIPGSIAEDVTIVPAMRFDAIAPRYLKPGARPMLKIDVQGGEDKLLAGASGVLDQLVGIVVELSLTEMYEGQSLAFDVLLPLMDKGFELIDIGVAYRSPTSYRLHCIDAVLMNRARMSKPIA